MTPSAVRPRLAEHAQPLALRPHLRSVARWVMHSSDVLDGLGYACRLQASQFIAERLDPIHELRLIVERRDRRVATLMPRWIKAVPPHDEPIDRVIVGVDLCHEKSLAYGTPDTERQFCVLSPRSQTPQPSAR